MPRGPRLDAPGILHHVVVRGIARESIFQDDRDRNDLVGHLADLVERTGLAVYAWSLLPNHIHLLLRTGRRPLPRVMRSLLTGYAGRFNRRHARHGHLFQNRYKSIVVEEEPYFLELVRYLHLNPIRAGLLRDLAALDNYPWTGHSAMIGRFRRPWQATDEVLSRFGASAGRARSEYRKFVAAGLAQGRRLDLQGGGLVRSVGGWARVAGLRRGREAYTSDERVLGRSAYVESLLQELNTLPPPAYKSIPLGVLIDRVCQAMGISNVAIRGKGRTAAICRTREGISYLWVEVLRESGPPLASALGIKPPSVYRAAQRGSRDSKGWLKLLDDEKYRK